VIVLDTNVISELMRAAPEPRVVAWVASQTRAQLYTTYINQIEVLYGIALLPEGRRRDALRAAAQGVFAHDFAGRVLSFDAAAAGRYMDIMLSRRRMGKPIEGFDALIAAIAMGAGAAVATRDVGGFGDCGLEIINPWAAP